MKIAAGIQISLDNSNWYGLTDHNREMIDIANNLIEKANRMSDGTMRKYVIASKRVFSTTWKNLPSNPLNVVDYGAHSVPTVSSAWLEAFYKANVFIPVYIKLTHATETIPTINSVPSDSTYLPSSNNSNEIIKCFITKFQVKINKRMRGWDYVDMDIEFTEI